MQNPIEKNILKFVRYVPVFFVLSFFFILSSLIFFENKKSLDEEIKKVKDSYYISYKKDIKFEVKVISKYVEYQKKYLNREDKAEIKQELYNTYIAVTDMYDIDILPFIISKGTIIYLQETNVQLKKSIENIKVNKKRYKKEGYYKDENITSYLEYFKDKDLLIGASFSNDKLNLKIQNKVKKIKENNQKYLFDIFTILLPITIILLIVTVFLSNRFRNKFLYYTDIVHDQIEENRRKDHLLSQQSKMAAMGEMMGNIAHQWRQPLSLISTASSALKLKQELGNLKEEDVLENSERILNATQHLSQTIEDFRNFFKPNKEKTFVKTHKLWTKIENLIQSQYENKNIQLITSIEDVEFITMENELIQVLLNILNNARDELLKYEEFDEKLIFISMIRDENILNISIKDNAGGIPDDIIHRVFEPYFTTKHKSQGTGIGLYMSEEIVYKHIKGRIEVQNEEFIYKDKLYKGALFKIKIPL